MNAKLALDLKSTLSCTVAIMGLSETDFDPLERYS
jgi:hypothetical protein